MLVLRNPQNLPLTLPDTALAIGNFDGFHKGHQAVINTMLDKAKARKLMPSVLTFEPHPRMFFKRSQEPLRIEKFSRKAERLKEAGVELLVVLTFNQALSSMSAENFVDDVLVGRLRAAEVITGENFMFGKNRAGDSAFLMQKGVEKGFRFTAVSPIHDAGNIYSSTGLRGALHHGDMNQAAKLLGRPYEIEGVVVHGDGRGKSLGAATANIRLGPIYAPRYGIYAVRFKKIGESCWHEGVASFGVRPTFGKNDPVLEVHGLKPLAPFYGEKLTVQWLAFLRDEIAYDDVEALKTQIQKDIATARQKLKEFRIEQA
ncbi:MAG: bifunctional riboflavin kinase/FAD synthetase [Rickettsiales bacterium]